MRWVRGLLVAAQAAALVADLVGLLTHGPDLEPVVDCWLSGIVQFLPGLIAWSAVPGARARRAEVTFLAP